MAFGSACKLIEINNMRIVLAVYGEDALDILEVIAAF